MSRRERAVSRHTRDKALLRAAGLCEYCRIPVAYSPAPFAIEHIVPLERGGPTVLENLALACQGCNGHKSTHTTGVDPLTGETVALYHPRMQEWSEHFRWSEDWIRVVGVTITGRATVQVLRLNRPGLLNLRALFRDIGKHPPADPPSG